MKAPLASAGLLLLLRVAIIAQTPVDSLTGSSRASTGDTLNERLIEQTSDDSPIIELLAPPVEEISVRSRIGSQLQTAAGYLNHAYAGSPLRSSQRINAGRKGVVSAGGLIEKDAGERSFTDFTTAYILFPSLWGAGKLLIGDYTLEEGEGLAWWRGASYGKGAEVMAPVVRRARGIVPHRSSGESSFLRGAAAEVRAGHFTATLSWSRKNLAATLDGEGQITGFPADGLFRTLTEEKKRNDASERLYGISLNADAGVGMTWYATRFSRELRLDEGRVFAGRSYSLLAVHYSLKASEGTIFGEWARSNGALGGISGVVITPAPSFALVAAVRSYPKTFLTLHAAPFGERGSNERGVYAGLRTSFGGGVTLSCFFDRFADMSAAPGKLPPDGRELLIEPEMKRGALRCAFRYRAKSTSEQADVAEGLTRTVTGSVKKESVRLTIETDLPDGARLTGRFERTAMRHTVPPVLEQGAMLSVGTSTHLAGNLSLDLQAAFFQTDSYDAGIAEVEHDVPGVVALPVLYGRGVRWSVVAGWSFQERWRLSAKYAEVLRDDVKRIGTGADELPSNRDNRVTVQLDAAW